MRALTSAGALLFAALACNAQECPWINAATAAGILEGPVEAHVETTAKDAAVGACEFARRWDNETATLQVEVKRQAISCGAGATAIRSLGNEAYACAVEIGGFGRKARVIGRVREYWFSVAATTTDRRALEEALPQEALHGAEQVVGNLY